MSNAHEVSLAFEKHDAVAGQALALQRQAGQQVQHPVVERQHFFLHHAW